MSLFTNMYNLVKSIFRKDITRPIPKYITETYYIRTGKELDGEICKTTDTNIIIRSRNNTEVSTMECIFEDKIIEVILIPYDIYNIKGDDLCLTLYKIYNILCNNYYPKTCDMRRLFKHAPYALMIYTYSSLFETIDVRTIANIINDKFYTRYTDDISDEILNHEFDICFKYTGLLNILDEYKIT